MLRWIVELEFFQTKSENLITEKFCAEKKWSDRASLDFLLRFNEMKSWKTKLKKLKMEKLKVEKRNAEFSLKFTFTF